MATKASQRKARFEAALREARMTARQFAAANNITKSHLSHVLSGRESRVLEAKIDAFIAKYPPTGRSKNRTANGDD